MQVGTGNGLNRSHFIFPPISFGGWYANNTCAVCSEVTSQSCHVKLTLVLMTHKVKLRSVGGDVIICNIRIYMFKVHVSNWTFAGLSFCVLRIFSIFSYKPLVVENN